MAPGACTAHHRHRLYCTACKVCMSSLGASHRDRTRATRGYPGLATSDYIQLCRRTDRAGPARTSIPTVGCRPKYGPGIATQLERPGAGAFGGTTRGDPLVSIVTGWGRLFAACSLSSLPLHWSEAGIIRLAATEDPGYAARRRLQCWLCCVYVHVGIVVLCTHTGSIAMG